MQKPRKLQGTAASKRIAAVQEAQRKVWSVIAIKEIPRVHKYQTASYIAKSSHLKRLAHLCTNQARKPHVKTIKATKEMQLKSKRLMRDMLVFWRKNEKEERDGRKRAEKEAVERAKEEEEKREAARQARKLEFLISQTELYSHFVGNKLKKVGTSETPVEGPSVLPAGVELDDESPVDPTSLQDLNFDDDDQTNLYRHAKRNAQDAIAAAKQRAQEFDTQAILDRKTNEALALAAKQSHIHDDDSSSEVAKAGQAPLTDLDSDELNFQNPTSLSGQLTIAQPRMLMAQLKEYQLKGLNWLATLYEQGINGILADEMGLGKTVQSISLLAYLAETHDIWGPFLVIAPASTLHNWQQELSRFVPDLKALPYWGNVKDRTVLRKFWNRKQISYNKDAPFHVLITSYQLVLADEKYFQRVNWQYMILDEAQNIKNSSSARWKTLLSFHCRNRLLLTGTPIQNSMQELWALLHFIMPSLFDSHDEFSEWFSKDIENAAENKGSKLNEHQLRRLHMILKPFMLRRVKRHVQNELSEKIEIDIYCDLSYRQRALYRALRANVSITELLEKAANIGDADSARSLMNLVMQFRKVCNHPELFERADVVAPYSFCHFGAGNPLREGDFLHLPYSTRSPLEFHIPSLFYLDGGLVSVPSEDSQAGQETRYLYHLMNIWSTDWMEKSIQENIVDSGDSPFNFIPLLDRTTSEIHSLYHSPEFMRLAWASHENAEWIENAPFLLDSDFVLNGIAPPLLIARPRISEYYETAEGLPPLGFIGHRMWMQSCLSRPALQWGIAPAMAPPLTLVSGERTLVDKIGQIQEAPLESLALYGLPPSIVDTEPACHKFNSLLPHIPIDGFLKNSPSYQLPWSTMQVPDAKRLIFDSAKLARLDTLLQELKAGDHKVLVYFQMTKMMDLMEEYLIYRQYKYLRLDGSSKLEDRRDMVMDWQTRPDIFIFLLSTRAGGLGINLTAADTVVFYDHDWNPSNDSQAMDRAHRLGQTRQVTVYRLITKGTIDERIIQLARVKKDVQDIVVGNKQFTDVAKPSEIVSLLLNDDELATLGAQGSSMDRLKASDSSTSDKRGSGRNGKDQTSTSIAGPSTRDLWNEEGDDFFGSSATVPNGSAAILDEEAPAASTPSTRGRKNGTGTGTGAKRGRKPGSGKGVGHRKKPGPVTGDTLPEDL
ncbi:hypothetical protein SISSUDRAFT_976705 [Sistotremastrum suecicum HHB10207 ss-3]|uniref:Chromatin-remodeling ATPase INO80 n=1 Tax=Sistotremastrum suecicum HHB10207 ss-3 TaxID=1314776 RepID=A0A166JE23_9AGAM|nr:hypothetical protein SISSUDRAFT_976705 [Sistotremastrum suecicum HHB10207 ss-3]